jgi:hypothetical protein
VLFEKYEQFISLIFNIFSGRGKPQILNQWIRGHDCTYSSLHLLPSALNLFHLMQCTAKQNTDELDINSLKALGVNINECRSNLTVECYGRQGGINYCHSTHDAVSEVSLTPMS